MKRFIDIVLAASVLIITAPVWVLALLLIRMSAKGSVFARPHRVGRHGKMLKVFEFSTAVSDPDAMETVAGCHGEQVTGLGAILRRVGIARWPMLINVLKGELSIVGPRAELPRYVGCYPTAARKLVLSVKPGLIDLASIEFTQERKMLANLEGDALEEAYVEKVLPIRIEYAERYVAERGFWTDLRIIGRSLMPMI
jgi:lipopolysaccharide/colanic/teichoic acid biosynthesis glycosyltransferase